VIAPRVVVKARVVVRRRRKGDLHSGQGRFAQAAGRRITHSFRIGCAANSCGV
jgi:hypothetical protein